MAYLPMPNYCLEAGGNMDSIKSDLDAVKTNTANLSTTQPVSGTVTVTQGNANSAAHAWSTKIVDSGLVNVATVTGTGAVKTDASATTQPVSGTVTSNQGTAAAASSAWPHKIVDSGGVNIAAVSSVGALKVDASSTTITTTSTQGTPNSSTNAWPIKVVDTLGINVANVLSSGALKVDGSGATQPVDIKGNTGATLDSTITAATAPSNAVATSLVCQTSAPSLSAGQAVMVQGDYQGSHFVKPYRRGQTGAKATTIASSSAATTVVAAQAAGIFADISSLIITCASQTSGVAFTATLSDGTNSYIFDLNTGSTTVLQIAPILQMSFNPPLPAASAATAWTIALSSASVTVHITAGFVLQKAS